MDIDKALEQAMQRVNDHSPKPTLSADFSARVLQKMEAQQQAEAKPKIEPVPLKDIKKLRLRNRIIWAAAASIAIIFSVSQFFPGTDETTKGEGQIAQVTQVKDDEEKKVETIEEETETIKTEEVKEEVKEATPTPQVPTTRPAQPKKKESAPVTGVDPVTELTVQTTPLLAEATVPEVQESELDRLIAQARNEVLNEMRTCDKECFNEKIMAQGYRLSRVIEENTQR